jgi:ribose transport system permease protein
LKSASATNARSQDEANPASRGASRLRNIASNQGLLVVLVVLLIAFSVALPQTFPTMANARNILTSQSVILMIALAVTLPLRAGDFDLSVSAVMALSASIIAVLCVQHQWSLASAVPIALLAGLLVGAINAALVVKLDLDGFVATLGTMTAILGLTTWMTEGEVIAGLPAFLSDIANFRILTLPAIVLYGWALVLVLWYVYEHTPFGRYLLFTGGNREAARLTGIKVDRTRAIAFILASLISALAGILFAGAIGAVDPSISHAYLLPPYAAAFLGSTTIQIGRFNALGTVVGLYLLAIGVSGLQLMGAAGWVTDFFHGIALIASVAFAKLIRKMRSS